MLKIQVTCRDGKWGLLPISYPKKCVKDEAVNVDNT